VSSGAEVEQEKGAMDRSNPVMSIDTVEASDGWGFVGRVLVGDVEVYRTVRAPHATAPEALQATARMFAGLLGRLLTGQEWHDISRA
jgi:hypothetical protein